MSKSIKDLPAGQMYCQSCEIYFAQRHFPEKWKNYPSGQIDDQFTQDLIDNKEVNVNASRRIVETMHSYLTKNKYLIEDIDNIVWVPLHESHGKKCNELCLEAELDKLHTKAASLAEMLAEKIQIPPLIDVLMRVQKSNPHKRIAQERLCAAEVDYEISYNISRDNTEIKDKYILLIDDILTSTATTKKCIKLLKANGAKKVTVFCAGKTVFRDVFDNKNFLKTKFLARW